MPRSLQGKRRFVTRRPCGGLHLVCERSHNAPRARHDARRMNVGSRVGGRFAIEARVAVGGMGAVYRATDVTTGDTVAVKVLRDIDAETRARLEREALALSQISHPNIVRYVAHGRQQGSGEPHLVMEWIEGETLAQRLKRAPLSTSESLLLVRVVADALGYLHDRGLVHRDIKPGNLVLRGDRLEGVTIVDFGLVRAVYDDDASITRTGTIVGTPTYMAPEQARGERDVGPAADVFALGCVLFRCVTGRSAFEAIDGLAVLAKVLLDEPPHARELVRDLDARVDDVMARMLAKAADERPPNGAAVARLIDEIGAVADVENLVTLEQRAPARLGLEERKLRTVVLAATQFDRDATVPRSTGLLSAIRARLARFEAHSDVMASGAIVVTILATDSAKEHAVKAAACALALAEVVSVPIVVATGHSVTSERGASSTPSLESDVFERAARLLRGAEVNPAIRIDDTTAALLAERGLVVSTPSGLELRGMAAHDDGARTLLGRPTAFVGRDRELVTLEAVYDECVREQTARAVLVTGAPRIGKSRLRRELVLRLRARGHPFVVLSGAADSLTRGAPFAVLAQAVSSFVGISQGDGPQARSAKLRARVKEVVRGPDSEGIAEWLAELCAIDVGAPSDRRGSRADPVLMYARLRRAFCDFLAAECALNPVVLVLDDLQWVDALTPRLVDAALGALAERPFLVLGFSRPEIADSNPNLWGARGVLPLPLGAISRRAATAFVGAALPAAAPSTTERIVSRAGGNPLYLEELIRAEDSCHDAAPPETVLAMVQSRLADLDGPSRRVLRAASVFGAALSTAGLGAVLSEEEPSAIDSLVEHLVRRELFVRNGEGLAFRHGLVRDVAYGMLTEADARLAHRRAAEHMERAAHCDPAILAEHYSRSDEPSRAIAPLVRSAHLALDASDFGRALAIASRARAAGAPMAECALVEAEAHRWLGETGKAYAAAAEALGCIARSDPNRLEALRALAYGASYLGRLEDLEAVYEELASYEPTEDLTRAYLFAVSQTATSLVIVGNVALGERLLEKAKLHYEECRADPAVVARYLEARVACAAHAGDLELLLETATAARANAELAGNDRAAILQTINVGFAWMQLGEYDEALRAFERARTESEWLGLVSNSRSAMQNAGYVLLRLGRVDEARELERAVLAQVGEETSTRLVTLTHACLATLELRAGDVAAAERHARAAVAAATGLPQAAYAATALAEALLASEDHAGALASADRALDLMRKAGGHHFAEATALLVRALALRGAGRPAEARDAIGHAERRLRGRATRLSDARREKFLIGVEENRRTRELARDWS